MRQRRYLIALLTLTFTALATAQGVGSAAPAFSLVDSHGEPTSLAEFRGKPLILNVWASWCGPCVEELPFFQRLYDEVNADADEEGLEILLLNNGEDPAEAVSFLQDLGVTLPTALEPTKEHREVSEAQGNKLDDGAKVRRSYRVRGMPTTFFIDATGTIRAVKVGLLLPSEAPALLASIGVNWQP